MGYNSVMTKEVIMTEQKLIEAFKEFARYQGMFEQPIALNPFLQLIAAIGFTEDIYKPKTELMEKLIEALGFELDDVAVQDVLEGNVY